MTQLKVQDTTVDLSAPKGMLAAFLYRKGFSTKGAEIMSTVIISAISTITSFVLTSLGISAIVVI